MRLACVAALLGVLMVQNSAPGQDAVVQHRLEARQTLAGLRGVTVVVEDVRGDISAKGITTESVQTDAELRLRQSGIPVLDKLTVDGAVLTLQIELLPLSTPQGSYAFDIHLDLSQHIQLVRNPNTKSWAVTWSAPGMIGVVGMNKLSTLRESAREMVDNFANQYLAANSKK